MYNNICQIKIKSILGDNFDVKVYIMYDHVHYTVS